MANEPKKTFDTVSTYVPSEKIQEIKAEIKAKVEAEKKK